VSDFWVFAYGSLMWRPGFDFVEARPALLRGYHRALCVYSEIYRGTPERPGLVLGLDRGGACRGTAYRVHATQGAQVRAYQHEREMKTTVYHPRTVAVAADGRRVHAHAYVVNRSHPLYAGRLPVETLVALVLQGEGTMGRCRDYLARTVHHLREQGVFDPGLERLLGHVEAAQRLEAAAE
jgi:cation transport protein ChaC